MDIALNEFDRSHLAWIMTKTLIEAIDDDTYELVADDLNTEHDAHLLKLMETPATEHRILTQKLEILGAQLLAFAGSGLPTDDRIRRMFAAVEADLPFVEV